MNTDELATKKQVLDLANITEMLLEALRSQQEALRCQQEALKVLSQRVDDLENRVGLVEELL